MEVAVFGWGVSHENFDALAALLERLHAREWKVWVYDNMLQSLRSQFGYVPSFVHHTRYVKSSPTVSIFFLA